MPLITAAQLTEMVQAGQLRDNPGFVAKGVEFLETIKEHYDAELKFSISGSGIEAYSVWLKHELPIKIQYNEHRERYDISLFKGYNLPSNIESDIKEYTGSPMNVGKLTKNKIKQWVQYWEKVDKLLIEEVNKRELTTNEFMFKLRDLPVVWTRQDPNDRRGYIRKGGLEYGFTLIHGVVTQKIVLNVDAPIDLSTFLKMANNNL